MYLTMYLFKKLYFMVLSNQWRDTERPTTVLFSNLILIKTIKPIVSKNTLSFG